MKYINRYLNIGVRKSDEQSLVIRIRLLNVLNISCIVVSLVYAFINSSVHEIATFINLSSVLVNIAVFGLVITHRPVSAFVLYMLLTTYIGISFAILFGEYIASHLLFCTGIAYSIAIFDNKIRMFFGVILNVLCYIIASYFYENYNPVFTERQDVLHMFYYPNTAVFLTTLFVLVFLLKSENRRFQNILKERNTELAKSSKRNQELLLNILPAAVAKELIEQGKVEPRMYPNATVMFTDFYQFTTKAEKISAIELVAELDGYFKLFDGIMEKYGIEKLKTIGDAYMCVAGIPNETENHAKDMICAALDLVEELEKLNSQRENGGKESWQIRIGIHTGQVVAGVIGQTKFAYDIWGDAVNTAARMESSGEPGKINISETTYRLVKNDFRFTPRGKVEAKNKGEMHMYFVEGKCS